MAATPATMDSFREVDSTSLLHSPPAPPVAFEVEISDTVISSPPPSVPKRLRRRLLESPEHRCKSPSSLEEIEAKLKEADSRRQQFHEWLANKAKPKVRSPRKFQPEDLAGRLHTKLVAAEQKRLELLAQEQTRLAKLEELRAAARTEVQLRAEREREELESRVESRVHQAETNRLALLEAEKQKRALVHERIAHSIVQRTAQEDKDKERLEALRLLIRQKIAAADEKRESLLKAEKSRAQAKVLQARKIAKAVRRKRELELRNKKELLEARLQRAKRLRAEYLGQRGGCQGTCHNNGHKMKKHGERLNRKLTRCWRQFRTSRKTTVMLAQDYAACNIDRQIVRSLPFEELAGRITSPNTLRSVKALLARIESRFMLSAGSGSNIAQIDHLLKRLSPPTRKQGGGRAQGSLRRSSQRSTSRAVNITQNQQSKKSSTQEKVEEKVMERYPARVFLCAYMIIGHPEAVFSSRGDREAALSEAALKLIPEFEALLSIILDGPASNPVTSPSSPRASAPETDSSVAKRFSSQLAEFDEAWCSYLYHFVAWKVQDARLLEEDLIRMACQLEVSMLQKCSFLAEGDASDASHDTQAIQKQVLEDQQLLRERILHLTGAAGVSRLEAALVDTRNHCAEARENGSPLPSPFASPQKSKNNGSSSLPSSDLFKLEPKETDVSRPLLNSFNEVATSENPSLDRSVFTNQSSGPPKPMDNERLVNEMIHEPNWNDLNLSSRSNKATGKIAEIEGQVKKTIEKAFWDGIFEGLSKDPPDYSRIVSLLEEVKSELENLVPDGWKQELYDSLDVEIFSQVLHSGNHDYVYFRKLLDYALSIVLKLGAPARDDETKAEYELMVKELSQASSELGEENLRSFAQALVRGLRFVLEQIQVLKVDISNAKIQALAPILQGSAGIEYLQKAFSKRYMVPDPRAYKDVNYAEKLPKTANWLSEVKQHLQQDREELEALRSMCSYAIAERGEVRGPPLLSSMRTGGSVVVGKPSVTAVGLPAGVEEQRTLDWGSPRLLIGLGLLSTISGFQAVTEDNVPETMTLNVHRLRKAQNDYQRIVIMTTGLLLIRQNAAARGMAGTELDELLKLGRVQLDKLLDDPLVTVSQIGDLLVQVSGINSDTDLITRVLTRSLLPDDAVFKRVSAAIQSSLRAIVLLGNGAEGLALAGSSLQRVGAVCLQESVVNLGTSLDRLASITYSIHGPWYACIVS